MKKVGITVDNYKLEKFKNELRGMGWELETFPLTKDTTVITIHVEEKEVVEVYKLCKKLELHFKNSN